MARDEMLAHRITMDSIDTWAQGYFVNHPQYRNWAEEDIQAAKDREVFNVRPAPTENAVCKARTPLDATWVALRLNQISKIQTAYLQYHQGTIGQTDLLRIIHSVLKPDL